MANHRGQNHPWWGAPSSHRYFSQHFTPFSPSFPQFFSASSRQNHPWWRAPSSLFFSFCSIFFSFLSFPQSSVAITGGQNHPWWWRAPSSHHFFSINISLPFLLLSFPLISSMYLTEPDGTHLQHNWWHTHSPLLLLFPVFLVALSPSPETSNLLLTAFSHNQDEDEHLFFFPFPTFSPFLASPERFFFPIWKWADGLFRLPFSIVFFPFSFLPLIFSPSSFPSLLTTSHQRVFPTQRWAGCGQGPMHKGDHQ